MASSVGRPVQRRQLPSSRRGSILGYVGSTTIYKCETNRKKKGMKMKSIATMHLSCNGGKAGNLSTGINSGTESSQVGVRLMPGSSKEKRERNADLYFGLRKTS
jgi:hypothetical protein